MIVFTDGESRKTRVHRNERKTLGLETPGLARVETFIVGNFALLWAFLLSRRPVIRFVRRTLNAPSREKAVFLAYDGLASFVTARP